MNATKYDDLKTQTMNYIILFLIISIYPFINFIKNIIKSKTMNSILERCQMRDGEVLIVLTEAYECPIHQCCNANHYNDCKNIDKNMRIIGLYENDKYIAIACKKGARFIVSDKFIYKGEYTYLRERVGSGEWSFNI